VPSEPAWLSIGLRALIIVMHAAALALFFGPVRHLPASQTTSRVPWPILALMFAAAYVFPVHFEIRREAHTLDLREIPLVLGLHFLAPTELVLARLIGSLAAMVLHARYRGLKLAFNIGVAFLETCLAVTVFSLLLGGAVPASGLGMLASFGAVLITDLVSATLVTTAIALHSASVRWDEVVQAVVAGVVAALANTSLGLIAASTLVNDPRTAWLLLVVAVILVLAYRAYASLRRQHRNLELLDRFTRQVGRSERTVDAIAAILSQARELLRAEWAEITLLGGGDTQPAIRYQLSVHERLETVPIEPGDPMTRLLEQVVAEDRAVLLGPPLADAALERFVAASGISEAMVAPLHAAAGAAGTLLIANRMGDVSTFGTDDLTLLQTLAGHASVTLEKGQLFDSLRHEAAERERQALHDALTGLPNRALFTQQVSSVIGRAGSGARAAVLLMDLDRFKEVNDTLGHHAGDVVLREVGDRLRRNLPDACVIARLGGDEFAVLVPHAPDRESAVGIAWQMREALERPLGVGDLSLELGGSIGIAMSPEHGSEPVFLLQRADVAMYAAKAAHSGVEIYAPEHDRSSTRRLALVGMLRAAIERGELTVHYQPKAELASGRVVGVEALARWDHPAFGSVPPDEFIPLAEATGLIRPLTLYVLETALGEARRWQDRGFQLHVAVNVSVRNLLDPELIDSVIDLLGRLRVSARRLTLEITEGQIMEDPERMIQVLHGLRSHGIQLSVDDFGTGYSSLAYLKRLPVNEVKVDKSFVTHAATDQADAAIVRSAIDLGRNLGLRVVAEGIEDRQSWDLLAAMGCDLAQGYYLARPMPAAELLDWLSVRPMIAPVQRGGRSAQPGRPRN
jgi:diguanylate cyclase (GGDEF)-like protein